MEIVVAIIIFFFVLTVAAMFELVRRKKAQQREINKYETPKVYEGVIFKPDNEYHQPKEVIKRKSEPEPPLTCHVPSFCGPKDGTSRMKSYEPNITKHKSSTNYFSTPPQRVEAIRQSQDDGFLTSMVVAEITDSTALGYLAGGNLTGSLVGSALHSHSDPTPSYSAPETSYSDPVEVNFDE